MDRLIRLVMGQGMRFLVTWIAKRGDKNAPPEARAQNQQTARKINQTMRVMRRVGRF